MQYATSIRATGVRSYIQCNISSSHISANGLTETKTNDMSGRVTASSTSSMIWLLPFLMEGKVTVKIKIKDELKYYLYYKL